MPVYYVNADAGGDTGAGNEGDPWQTLAAAVSRMRAGDTLKVADGTYADDLVIPRDHLTIEALGEKAIMDGGSGRLTGWTLESGRVWRRAFTPSVYGLF